MKILQINKYFYRKGGSETVFFTTIDLLKKNGHTVIPFSLNHKNNEQGGNSYFINYPELSNSGFLNKLKYSFYFFYNLQAKRQLKKLIENERPDIAHIHLMFNSFSIAILPVLKKYKIPVILTAHDYRLICPSYLLLDKNLKICEKCKTGKFYKCALGRCAKGHFAESLLLTMDMYIRKYIYPIEKYVDKILCVSDFSVRKHIEFNRKWQHKIERLYNPVYKSENPKINRGNYLLYIGRISREKGIKTLLDAARLLPDVNIKIAGSGVYKDELKDIPQNIIFLGNKNREELNELIGGSSFVIVPSEWYETFGLVVVEAFSNATPVIASDIGGISELVNNNEDGFLFRAGDLNNMIEVITKAISISDSSYASMANNAMEKSRLFDPQKYYERLMAVYNHFVPVKK
ncbi:MAG: glycosyltransferase family 4 protein [Bacteroidales bacterium]|nr:glycosyltransferase family 4 protein [Bacteroidales bacterium]